MDDRFVDRTILIIVLCVGLLAGYVIINHSSAPERHPPKHYQPQYCMTAHGVFAPCSDIEVGGDT